jgi:hypothetical protein
MKIRNAQETLLGRNGWLSGVRTGLVDYDSLVYFSPYVE